MGTGLAGEKFIQAKEKGGVKGDRPSEGVKRERDKESHWALRLFKFVVLIDNVFHFFCVGGI